MGSISQSAWWTPQVLWLLLPCFQVMGHHNANLDPLGISCVNFDETPVATGFQHVGEKCFLSSTAQQTNINEPVLCDCCFLLPFICPFFSHFTLSPVFQLLCPIPLCTRHFIFDTSYIMSIFLCSCCTSLLYLLSPPSVSFPCGWFCVRLPCLWGDPLVSCRYVVTMWLSWTLLGLWMLIWTHAFPPTLLRHRINSVRNSECPPNYTWLGLRCFVKTAFYDSW